MASRPAASVNVWAGGACNEVPSTAQHQWLTWEADLTSDCCPGGTIIAPDGIPRNIGLLFVWLLLLCCAPPRATRRAQRAFGGTSTRAHPESPR